jgi:multiple sugar transport system substrate-binding protein
MSKSTEALYYNKTFIEEHGLKVPTTWDEMEEVCRAIKAIDPTCVPLGYDSESNWFITMCEQSGEGLYTSIDSSEHFLFDNPTTKAFVKEFRQWHQDGLVTTEEIYGSYTSGLFTATGDNQKCYMVIGSTGGASYQTPPETDGVSLFETAMATPPQVNPASPKVISQGPSLCIFKDSNPQEVVASWLFVKFLTTDVSFQAAFSMKSGYAPVIKSVQKNEVYQQWLDSARGKNEVVDGEQLPANLTAMSVKLALAQEKAYFVSPAFNGSSEARDQVGVIMQTILVYEGQDVDAAIDKAFKEAMEECEYALG